MTQRSSYYDRRLLRTLEGAWTRVDGLFNRLTSTRGIASRPRFNFNPMYYLGVISIFLLLVIAVTGIYLTIVYRPGADRAFESMQGISATWVGSIMRSVHRYASDALIVTVLLHTLKMLFSDRFWGSRWLAWVTGWVVTVLLWIIGVMGYWLVWDQRAQWLTEYLMGFLRGPIPQTFASPDGLSRAFAFFVIILFLHVFLSLLIIVGLVLHEMRLRRARVWAPHWINIGGSVILIALAVWRPVVSALPADAGSLVTTLTMDVFYLGFLPLAVKWGDLLFWGPATLLLGVLVALPWLAQGRNTYGPAVVMAESCTGCAICALECPFGAIEMTSHTTSTRHEEMAIVNQSLCVGCGLCIADCAPISIELTEMPVNQIQEQLNRSLMTARVENKSSVVVFACQRHVALGTLPASVSEGSRVYVDSLLPAPAPVFAGAWGGGNPHPSVPVVTCSLPCVGMMKSDWIRDSVDGGAQAVVVASCPTADCSFREGPSWLTTRLGRGRARALLSEHVHWLEVAPGDQAAFSALMSDLTSSSEAPAEDQSPPHQKSKVFSLAAGLIVLAVTLGLALLADLPVTATTTDQGAIRIAFSHPAEIKTVLDADVADKLPEGVSAEQVLGGERYPVQLRLEVDGESILEESYSPSGLRREGASSGLESLWLAPGSYQVSLWMMDDGESWREVFTGPVEIETQQVSILAYDKEQDAFLLR
jgi:ferredoxin